MEREEVELPDDHAVVDETARVSLRLPEELVTRADIVSGMTNRSRTAFIEDSLLDLLGNYQQSPQFQRFVLRKYKEGEVSDELLKTILYGSPTAEWDESHLENVELDEGTDSDQLNIAAPTMGSMAGGDES